jgi:single-stranded-DNA-specific exonuclease
MQDANRLILGVSRSVSGRTWRARLDPAGEAVAAAISQSHGVPDLLARVLAARGVGIGGVDDYLEPRLRDLLPDPASLRDMDVAAARLADAIERGEHVALFGDYDVDGATSCAILGGVLRRLGLSVCIHIPDRITEGYGPNVEAIRALAASGATLLVTLDCGTTSHEPLAEARRLGLGVVVIDHHQAGVTLPEVDALVNPNRLDDVSGLGHLCAAGVTFLVLVALVRDLRRRGFWSPARPEPDLLAELDLVALGTVADVMPLVGLNRAFVRQGLRVMRARERVGLAALADVARLKEAPEAWHLGFLIGPRINAGGRVGDASLGTRLLIGDDEAEAARIAATLDRLNEERRGIEQASVAEATAQAERDLDLDPSRPVLMTRGEDWHPGVVGLVASRLKERFRRPAFAFAQGEGDLLTGSARSIPGVDLGRMVRGAVEAGLALKGGGHAMAAGLTLPAGGWERFADFAAQALAAPVAAAREADVLAIDAALTAGGARPEIVEELARAGPFGAGSPEPLFVFGQHVIADASVVGEAHVRATLRASDGASVQAIAFRSAGEPLGQALLAARGSPRHVAGHLAVDAWGGRRRAQLRIVDLAEARPHG